MGCRMLRLSFRLASSAALHDSNNGCGAVACACMWEEGGEAGKGQGIEKLSPISSWSSWGLGGKRGGGG